MSQEQDDANEAARRATEANNAQAASAEELVRQNQELKLAVAALLGGLGRTGSGLTGVSGSSASLSRVFTSGTGSVSRLMQEVEGLTEAEKRNRQAAEEETIARNLNKQGMQQLGASVGSLTRSLLDINGGFAKYTNTITSAGDAAFSFGKALGPVGTAIGGAIKALSMIAGPVLKYNDALLSAYDDMSKVGATTGQTVDSMRAMAAQAGFTSHNMSIFTKTIVGLGPNLTALGSTAAEGAKQFSEMALSSDKERNAFNRLGISQEQVIKGQADFVKIQVATGQQLSKSPEALKKQSAEYILSLDRLAALTGESVDKLQAQREEMAADIAYATHKAELNDKFLKLQEEEAAARASGNKELAASKEAEKLQIGKRIFAEDSLVEKLSLTMSKGQSAALRSQVANEGAITTQTGGMLNATNPELAKAISESATGKDVSNKALDERRDAIKEQRANFGGVTKLAPELAEQLGSSLEAIKFGGKDVKYDETGKQIAVAQKKKVEDEAGTGDSIKAGQNKLLNAEKTAREISDGIMKAINPLEHSVSQNVLVFGALTIAIVAATLALSKLALGSMPTGIIDMFKKGKSKGPSPVAPHLPTATRVPLTPGAFALPGASSMPAGPTSPLPQATRTSAILDHTGKPFQIPVAAPAVPVAAPVAAAETKLTKAAASLGKMAGPLSKVAKVVPGLATVASVGMGVHGAYTGYNAVEDDVKTGKITKAEGTVKKSEAVGEGAGTAVGGAAGGWAGAATGAMAGAAIGSVVPVLGTAIGAALGGLIGGGLGAWGGGTLGGKAGKSLGGMTGDKIAASDKEKIEKAAADKIKLEEAKKAAGLASAKTDPLIGAAAKELADVTDKKVDQEKDSLSSLEKSTAALTPFTTGLTNATVAAERLARSFDNVVTGTRKASIKRYKTEGRVPDQASSVEEAKQIGAANPEMSQDVASNMELMAAALKKQGIIDPKMIAATLGNVMKETEGKTKSENLDYRKTSNERIRKVFGSSTKGKTDEEINEMKSSPEKMGESMYGSKTEKGQSMGNMEPGDGWKFRGRGFIQLTGKANYAAASMAIYGDDRLVKNPDLVNNPKVAADCSAWYMKKGQSSMAKKLGIDTEKMDQSQANLLATSQIAGQDVRKMGAIGEEHSAKVDKHAAAFTPGTKGGDMVAAAGTKAPGVAVASADTSSKLTGRSMAQAKTGQGNPTSSTATSVASAVPASKSETDSSDPADLLKFGGNSGSASSFAGLDSGLQQQVLAAAKEYKDTTGKMLQVNSAKRDSEDQKRLYDETVASGTPGVGPSGMAVAKPGRSKHEQGQAIDIQQGKDDNVAVAAMNKQGLQQTVPGDPVHFQMPKAKEGGIFSGPTSGFPVELHGNELVAPLDPTSIIAKMLLSPATELTSPKADAPMATPVANPVTDSTAGLTVEMMAILTDKLDLMISKLSDSHDTQEKLLQHSRA